MVQPVNKLENYVFYTICERAYILFKKTYYLSFHSFCNGLDVSIKLNRPTRAERNQITQIVTYVSLVYGMDYVETTEYLLDFLERKKYFEYQESVMLVAEYFKNPFE